MCLLPWKTEGKDFSSLSSLMMIVASPFSSWLPKGAIKSLFIFCPCALIGLVLGACRLCPFKKKGPIDGLLFAFLFAAEGHHQARAILIWFCVLFCFLAQRHLTVVSDFYRVRPTFSLIEHLLVLEMLFAQALFLLFLRGVHLQNVREWKLISDTVWNQSNKCP